MANYQDATNFANKLKEIYSEDIPNLMGYADITINEFQKNKKYEWGGKGYYIDIHTAGNREALTSLEESETIPAAYRQRFNQMIVEIRAVASRIRLTEKTILASKGQGGIGANAVTTEIDGAFDDIMSSLEIQTFGYGQGVLGIVSATTTSSTSLQTKLPDYAKNIFKGDLIDTIVTLQSGTINIDGIRVAKVNYTTGVLTLGTASSAVADEYIVRGGLQDSGLPTTGFDIMGLQGHVDDGTLVSTYQNVARTGASGIDEVSGHVLGNSGSARPLTLLLLQQGVDRVWFAMGQNSNSKKGLGNFVFYVDEGQERALSKIQWPARIYQSSPNDVGTKGTYTFDGYPVEKRKHCPANTWLGIHKDSMVYFVLPGGELGFFAGYTGDNKILRAVADVLELEGIPRIWCNIGVDKPNWNVKVSDVQGQ